MFSKIKAIPPLKFEYDYSADVITIEGVKYTGELFRQWAEFGLELNQPFQIVERKEDGAAVIQRLKKKA